MKITVTQETIVNIDKEQVKRIVLDYLKELRYEYDMSEYDYIEKGFLIRWKDTGHGSGMTTTGRKAREIDKAILLLIKKLQSK